ncbi:Ser-Thr-rich glycosyl-phosphatidyl-inositol-anchored membrane family-domain-containing protein [Camillea tinctor]|nr:Ser-Thr-rich glycosyl-phosphatidyl-inositol-anchored membrane family-domain-containing protein [Camillea tinctor]
MKSVIASVFLAALAGLANAKVILTNTNYESIQVGQAFQITWADAEGPVTILLKNGAENDLKDVATLASGQTSGSFSWTPGSDLSGNYAFEITDGVDINYSPMFTLDGTPSTTTAATTGATTSTSSYLGTTQSASSTLTTITTSSSVSSTNGTATASTSSGSSSSAAPATTSGAANSSAPATTSASSTSSSRSSSATSAAATASQTVTPNNNDARGMVAPLVAPILLAIGAAFL